jgi:hypothetical protein
LKNLGKNRSKSIHALACCATNQNIVIHKSTSFEIKFLAWFNIGLCYYQHR